MDRGTKGGVDALRPSLAWHLQGVVSPLHGALEQEVLPICTPLVLVESLPLFKAFLSPDRSLTASTVILQTCSGQGLHTAPSSLCCLAPSLVTPLHPSPRTGTDQVM